ncbi:MAG TPA: hypothetical protein VHY83_03835 [Solirubrobacteraceae bacterium]|jgi:hypothetical protein|nr:hypothetical protein [Solirubrobacteraceae bacterium]
MRGIAISRGLILLTAMSAAVLTLFWACPAGAHELVEFESKAALTANGPIPPVPTNPLEEVKEVCGSETAVFGSELLNGTPPSKIKVKNEWGDIVAGKDMMVSGTISDVEESGGDLSIDHPFSRDFTFDVVLDQAYWPLARQLGPGATEGAGEHELHMELEDGQLLHALPQLTGPPEGESWLTLDAKAHENREAAYIPQAGDRIAMRGRWIIDCGHNDFHTELHPITFMAFGHAMGSKTVVHVISNPYRVTELYGFGSAGVNSAPKGAPFPQALEDTITSVTEKSIAGFPAAITMATGIERTQPSTAPWIVCKPTSGKANVHRAFVTRKGVTISVNALKGTNCATISARVGGSEGEFGKYTALQPPSRSCDLPYPLVNAEVAGGLGISGLRVNEIERITVNAGGGTFTISHVGDTTEGIPFNASAKEVQEALEKLASIGAGNVKVNGGPGGEGGGTPYFVEFVGSLAKMSIAPLTTSHSSLTPSKNGAFLATVVVLRPGGELDLHRFILSLIEQKVKAELEFAEEYGQLVGAIERIEANVARTPQVACLDPLSGPSPNPGEALTRDQQQPFPYYGEVQVE